MSSKLPKKLAIDRISIKGLTSVKDIVLWLVDYVRALDNFYGLLRDHIESGGMGTPNWDVKEAKAADVTDGNANTVGDLMFKHKTTGSEWLVEMNSTIEGINSGTVEGQMLYWDNTGKEWVKSDEAKLKWDVTNEAAAVQIVKTVRLLAGGVS